MITKLTHRVLAIIGVTLTFSFAIMGLLCLYLTYESTMDLQEKNTRQLVIAVRHDILNQMAKGQMKDFGNYVSDLKAKSGIVAIRLFDAKAREWGTGSTSDEIRHALAAGRPIEINGKTNGKRVHTLAWPLENEARCHACHDANSRFNGGLLLTTSLEEGLAGALHMIMILTAVGVFFFVVILGVLFFFFKKYIVYPILAMCRGVEGIAAGDLTQALEIGQQDEIGALAADLNLMRTSLLTMFCKNAHLEARVKEESTKSRAKDLVVMRQDKLASLGQLAAGVAHEINNPLTFVTGNIRVLTNYLSQMSTYLTLQQELLDRAVAEEHRLELAAAVHRLEIPLILSDGPALVAESLDGLERVARIVRDLKSFSRVDAPEYELTVLTTCLESALTIVANELKNLATIDREYLELPPVLCHSGMMNQVFLNLLTNAAHAITPPGRITLSAWHDAGFVYVAMEDNGHGISEELRERIFEPFFTTRDVGKGTGLGLSISHDIVARHGGELLVESSFGVGTIFTVKLPRTEETP